MINKLISKASLIAVALAVVLILAACASPTATPLPTYTPFPTPTPVFTPTAQELWQQQYDAWETKTYEAAKMEGKVVTYGWLTPDIEKALNETFAVKYPGIALEFVTGRSPEILERFRTEKATGQYIGDIYWGGQTTPLQLADMGITVHWKPPLEDAPGVKWFYSPTGFSPFPQIVWAAQYKGVVYNSDLVPADKVPKLWSDLLDPFWKDKIALDDPRAAGPGGSWLRWTVVHEPDELGEAYVLGLADQKPTLVRDRVGTIKAVARGEYAAYFPYFPSATVYLEGTPGRFAYVGPATQGTTSLAVLVAGAPHPNAAKLLLNYTLSDEWQKVTGTTLRYSPNNKAAPVGDPIYSVEGKNNYLDSPEDIRATPPFWAKAKEWFK